MECHEDLNNQTMGTSGMQLDGPEKLKYLVKNSWGLSFQKLLLLLLSLRWLFPFLWRLVSSAWQETLLSHFLSSTSCNFYYGWWVKLHFFQWKVKNYQGREICCLSWEILSISRPVYCSLGKRGWSYRWTWTFSQNHLVWLGEEHFQKNGSKIYRERYSGQIK